MFRSATSKDKANQASARRPAAPSILSVDLKITGDIFSDGEVHISGMVKGDVVAKKITIDEGGSVIGAVETESALIAGSLTGRLTAATVTLSAGARVVADITHVSLTIEQGAVFEGYSRRVDAIGHDEATLPLALPSGRGNVTAIAGGKATADHGDQAEAVSASS